MGALSAGVRERFVIDDASDADAVIHLLTLRLDLPLHGSGAVIGISLPSLMKAAL